MGSFLTISLEGVHKQGGDCPKEEAEFRSGKCVCRLCLLFPKGERKKREGRKANVGLKHEGLSGSLPPGYSPTAHCLTACLLRLVGWSSPPAHSIKPQTHLSLIYISPPPPPPELWPARWEKREEAWNNVDTSMGILKL